MRIVFYLLSMLMLAGSHLQADDAAVRKVKLTVAEANEQEQGHLFGRGVNCPAGKDGSLPFAYAPGKKLLFRLVGDKVRCDVNLDGKVDANDGDPVGNGGSIKVPVKLNDGTVNFVFLIGMVFEKQVFFVRAAAVLKGKVDDQEVVFYDRNCNGTFDDYCEDFVAFGKQKPILLSKIVVLGDKAYSLKIDPELNLILTPHVGALADVTVSAAGAFKVVNVLMLDQENGTVFSQTQESIKKTFGSKVTGKALPGKYRLAFLVLWKGDAVKGFFLSSQAREEDVYPITVPETNLKFGAPFNLKSVATYQDGVLEITDLFLRGCSGEHYSTQIRGGKVVSTCNAYLVLNGKEHSVGKMEYG